MIHTDFKRFKGDCKVKCEGCESEIVEEQPYFELYLESIGQTIHICEDCGNNLQNDMSDDYCRFENR